MKSQMNIYLLTREVRGYDEYDGFVIAAPTPKRAREIAYAKSGATSFRTKRATCTKIGETTTRRNSVILGSFNAG